MTCPRLRFPEFQNAPEWEEKKLEDISTITQGGTPDTTIPEYWNGDLNWLTPAEMGVVEVKYCSSTQRKITALGLKNCSSSLTPINSIIMSTRAPIGHLIINKVPMAINQGCKALTPNSFVGFEFLYYLVSNEKSNLQNLGAGNTFKELSGSALKTFESSIPSLPEQQKIADCFTSLDDLITAQNQKLTALKNHKTALMQQLFPAEGETTPRLRFPEFQNAPEWEVKKLGSFTTLVTKRAKNCKLPTMSITAGVGLITQIEKFGRVIAGNSYKNYYVINQGDFAYNKSATKLFPEGYIALYRDIKSAAIPNSIFICFTPDLKVIETEYLNQLFNLNYHGFWLRNFISVGARAHGSLNVNFEDLFNTPLPIPSLPEQQKIADCLTSLDDLITAQNQKITALKNHKTALMQQLFPTTEGM